MKSIDEFNKKARALKLLILDVDGVLTDGRLFFNDQGIEYKCFHARDGHGIKLLQQIGIDVAVISGRKSNAVALRMESLGVKHVFQGQENKIPALESLLNTVGVSANQVAHMGDDLPDLPIMSRVGLSITVNDG
ncbi:MAG: HAD-IIIA family hydrolase, partial [Methylococcales bacterium]|nr:HAD-IIIA family hydrolase [Methylococcales bacterium]